MTITRESIIQELKVLALFFGASIVQSYFMCGRCDSFFSYGRVIAFTFCMWVFLWHGNSLLTNFISTRISWIEYPLKRFAVGLGSTIAYTLLAILFLIFMFKTFVSFNFGSSIRFTVVTSVVVTVLITLFLHSREFLFFWRRAALDAEKYQRERVAAKYESLKSKVNPQLLHNSLEALGTLVYTDKENAVRFIKHLSEVYRYILDTREREIVSRAEEMKFLKSFLFLLETRFGQALNLHVAIGEDPFFIPPLSLQLIIEGVIANMTFSDSSPLKIDIRSDEDRIIFVATAAWGDLPAKENVIALMKNISDQFSFLSDRAVKSSLGDNSFTCEIPLIRPADIDENVSENRKGRVHEKK